jgi:uncharacterized membrane protein
MITTKIVKPFIVIAIIMLILDSIYLNMFSGFFNGVVTKVQGSKIKLNLIGAILCYILLVFGLNYFIISRKKPLIDAFILGIFIYGVYETTNYAILQQWSPLAVILDTFWGGILFTLTTYIAYKIL